MPRPSRAQLAAYARHPALRNRGEAAALIQRKLAARPARQAARAQAWSRRLPILAGALDAPGVSGHPVTGTPEQLRDALRHLLDPTDHAQAWLALAVLSAQLPTEETVLAVTRRAEFDGGLALAQAVTRATTVATCDLPVSVSDTILVDVDHTLSAGFLTGIQRVVLETVPRWMSERRCTPVAWMPGFTALRLLDPSEEARLRRATSPADSHAVPIPAQPGAGVIVPWGGVYVLPELALELPRLDRIRAMARYSPVRTGLIGYDCVPVTSSETVALGVGHFARNLAAVKYMDRVATISRSAAAEYAGWRQSLGGLGLTGPDIAPVVLPAQVPPPDPSALDVAKRHLAPDDLPLILVVGSHEPRKNHLAVLHAAELLWRDGLAFRLVFIGGRGWGSEPFVHEVGRLRDLGRMVSTETSTDDTALFAAYRTARFTVFPSLNEGFGLPVAESLACGTPAVTSDFGSMREIANDGGALLVDPRDDHSIAEAMRRLLLDDDLLARLRNEAAARPTRTWAEYADDTWAYLVEDDTSVRQKPLDRRTRPR